jgi:uncharacterized RDD family membrane protein YckC
MPSSNMQYFLRTPDGKEYGPAEQEVLVQWARNGRVSSQCQIRNSLVRKWSPAHKIPFLEGLVKDEAGENAPAKQSLQKRENAYSLNRPGRFKFVPAHVGLRFGAWLVDTLVLAVLAAAFVYAGHFAIGAGLLETPIYVAVTLLIVASYLLYYGILMGLTAQTLGQWFWGIMVVCPDGEPVLTGRACCFALLELLFGWSTLFLGFILPSKLALQDMLCGLRVIRITVREVAQAAH